MLYRLNKIKAVFFFSYIIILVQVVRDILLVGHRQAVAWLDEWHGKWLIECIVPLRVKQDIEHFIERRIRKNEFHNLIQAMYKFCGVII